MRISNKQILIIMFFICLILFGCNKQVDETHKHEFENGICECGDELKYYVIFKDFDGKVIKEEYVLDTRSASAPSNPIRDGYIFTGWSEDYSNVTKDLIVIALYQEEVVNKYTVTWVNDNGEILEVDYDVLYGTSPTYDGKMPEKDNDAEYTYTFSGWSPSIDKVTEDITYKAEYSKEVNKYTVTWINEDGDILCKQTVVYNEVPFYEYFKQDNKEYEYEFKGWALEPNGDVVETILGVNSDITYYAVVISKLKKYSLNIYDFYGNLVSSESYPYGTEINSPSEVSIERYQFKGWSESLDCSDLVSWPLVITKDITIYACYEKEKITVGETGQFTTIQDAVNYAENGDVIYIDKGLYSGVVINKSVELRGNNYNVNPNEDRLSETIINSDIIINASNVVINGVEIIESTKFTFDGLSNDVENIKFLYCKVSNTTINKDNNRNVAPFNIVSNNNHIIKNIVVDSCYIGRVSTGRPMAMYIVDVENLTIINSYFLGGSSKASFNDAIKIDNKDNSNAEFGVRGDVIIKNNIFKEYYQYAIWFRQYGNGNYLIENNSFEKIGQTADSHAAVNFISGFNINDLTINILSNKIENGYMLFRIDDVNSQDNIICNVNKNVMLNCNGNYYIKNGVNALLIDATRNYYGTSSVDSNKFYGDVNYSNYYTEIYDLPGFQKLELLYENMPYVNVGNKISILYECHGFNVDDVKWISSDESIATVNQYGEVLGITEGIIEITAIVEKYDIKETITVIVYESTDEMLEVSKFFLSIMNNYSYSVTAANSCQNYAVANPQLYSIYRGATKYLFEDLVIDTDSYPRNGLAPLVNNKVEYITIHDTWGMRKSAKELAAYFQKHVTSVHYTIGNDGIYQIVRLTDKAAHAGDSQYRAYALEKTDVLATNENPDITMIDGYFAINGIKTNLRPYTDYEGTIQDMNNYTTDQITYSGIRCLIGEDGYYYLGKTYFNETYKTISNFGGNANSIGMEIESQKGIDFYFNMQRTAKLVAMLMDKYNLTTNDVKMHNYFSGKNCAQLLKNNLKYEYNYQIDKHNMEDTLWDEFLELCDVELKALRYSKFYDFEFISSDTSVLSNTGRVIGHKDKRLSVPYTIRIIRKADGEVIELNSVIIIPSSSEIDPCYINR